jgi:predicted dithiol-disulfide oxidoreductase (DUF899 family)
MTNHKLVSRDEWLSARKALLIEEKEFTRQRDELSRRRRELPWVKVDKEYIFDGTNGKETLAQLFAGRSQLAVYHFMFPADWSEGCKSCSFWADNYERIVVHLNHRDVTLVTISKAPLEKLLAFKQRMGWTFTWLSSANNEFNRDYHVSFTPEELAAGAVYYNYGMTKFPVSEGPGLSVFYKDDDGAIYHTYSCYARGLDMVNGAYHWLDLMPKGRDEENLPYSMAWLRHRDKYEDRAGRESTLPKVAM